MEGVTLRWRPRPGIEVSPFYGLGVSRTKYAKRFLRPGLPETRTRDTPWLYNAAGALYLTGKIALYAGYTRGLEETNLPPQNAINRNQALPAILTQKDGGVRWAITGDLKLIAGVFEVQKPYFSLDPSGLSAQLGGARNCGLEASLPGTLAKGLTVALMGGRYQFEIGQAKATLRVSIDNVFDVYAYDYYGPSTFDYIPQRSASAYLAVDF